MLEKVKQAPNNVIEGAIDSLHTEYIKEAKEYIEYEIKNNTLINGYTDIYVFQTEVELLLKYIQHLEQKESILDKVTDKLKEIRRELDDDGFTYYAQEITKIENIIEGEKNKLNSIKQY